MKTEKEQLEYFILSINQEIKARGLQKDDSCIVKLDEGINEDGACFVQLEFCNKITRIQNDTDRPMPISDSGMPNGFYDRAKSALIINVFNGFIKMRDILGDFKEKK